MAYRNDSSIFETILKIGFFILIIFFPLFKKIFKSFTDALSEHQPETQAKRTRPDVGGNERPVDAYPAQGRHYKETLRKSLDTQIDRGIEISPADFEILRDTLEAKIGRQTAKPKAKKAKSSPQIAAAVLPEKYFPESDSDMCEPCYDTHENASPLAEALHNKNSLAQALVMSEIVGRPIALKNNNSLFDRLS